MINSSVILQAKVLLKNSDMTIESISEELNFPNSSNLFLFNNFQFLQGIPLDRNLVEWECEL